MAADKATDYIENVWNDTTEQIKDLFKTKEEIETEVEMEAE